MKKINYPNLFSPIVIGDKLFRNRIFSSPTGHPDVTLDGCFTEDAIAIYERKAQGGVAAITLGEAIVDSVYGKVHRFQLSLDEISLRHTLSRIADSISRHGAVPSIELQHSGMLSTPGLVTRTLGQASQTVYGPSDFYANGITAREMPEEIIWGTIEKFANAASFVKKNGFGMVTVHAAHGWLLNQFFAPRLNRRTDRWGGSAENRARLTVEVVDAIHRACGRDFPVEVRISATECHEEGYGIEEGVKFAEALDGHADIIHVSVGCSAGLPSGDMVFATTHPSMFLEDGVNVKYAAEVKKRVKKSLVATVGALADPALLEDIIASGKADIVEMARGLICDPFLPTKARDGREDDIVRCMRCLSCFSDLMQKGHFFCSLNPESGRERSFARSAPEARVRRVLIAGGGVGGMQAALTAAKCGHEVILCEKKERLGGNILCEENVPFKKHLKRYIAQRVRLIAEAGIDVRLNTEVTPELAKSLDVDVIIAALGAVPVKPDIPGIDGKNVLEASEAYKEPGKVGNRAVILGAGLVGAELSIYLASLGKKISVIEMAGDINPGNNILHGRAVKAQLRADGIAVYFNTAAVRIDGGGVWGETPDGERHFPCDTVIYAVGQHPLSKEAAALYDSAPHFYPLGDCVQPKTIGAATSAAAAIAHDIGRY